ncbi:hypothetical protein [Shewanella gaetbuli]|uniref:Lipoprotein n=1 Tax=Shewanella gaetbuli TaxID=220752 RepID=A0A9X1ZIX3_9GAMM|nr:hypothetical protein [Shewanella gaetbuli]
MQKKWCVVNLLILLLLLTACDNQQAESDLLTIQDPSLCNFHASPCKQSVANVTVELDLDDPFATSEENINITMKFSQDVENVQMTVAGRDMFMGVIPVALKQQGRTLTGQLIYGSCSSNYMVWRATVTFDYQDVARQVWFDFLADSTPS